MGGSLLHIQGYVQRTDGRYPPNGKETVFTGVSIYRLREGQIVEIREFYDKLGLYQQMGIIPALG